MKSTLRATAVLSVTSITSLLVSLLAVKVYALLLGPEGWGFMGLSIGFLALLRLVAAFGIGEGLVRLGARALGEGDADRMAALRRSAWLLCLALAAAAAAAVVVFRAPISRVLLGSPEHSGDVVVIGLAIFFALAAEAQGSLLNAYHRVGALARMGVLNVVLGAGTSVLLVSVWGLAGVPIAVATQAVVEWGVSLYFVRREVPAIESTPGRDETIQAGRDLLAFGVPYSLSVFAGRGVELLLPYLVLHMLDQASVGIFRAATAISVGYLGFLLDAMKKDYYPRVSAAPGDRRILGKLIAEQQRLVSLLSTPIIIGALALAPYLVPLVFTEEFSPAVAILEWQLIGDLFRFSSWTLAYVILARGSGAAFFSTELFGGAALVLGSWAGMEWFGLTGLGIGFLFAYVVYYLVASKVVKSYAALAWSWERTRMVLVALAAVFVIRGLPALGLESWRTPVAVAWAGALTLSSWRQIRRELGSREASKRLEKPADHVVRDAG